MASLSYKNGQARSERRVHKISLGNDESSALRLYLKPLAANGHNLLLEYVLRAEAYKNMDLLHITSLDNKNRLAADNLIEVSLIMNGKRVPITDPTQGVAMVQELGSLGYDLMRGLHDGKIAQKGIEASKERKKFYNRIFVYDGNSHRQIL